MMNEVQYFKYVEKMVKENLDVQFSSLSNSELDRASKNIIATLFANPALLNPVVNNLINWSYEQAEKNNFEKTPHMASLFLSPTLVRNYTIQYINYITQGKRQVMENHKTR